MKVGYIVAPTNNDPLRDGHGQDYGVAIVACVEPFVLVSTETDMRWSTRKPEDFRVMGVASAEEINSVQHRLEGEEVKFQVRQPCGEALLTNQLGCGLTLTEVGLTPRAVDLNRKVKTWPTMAGWKKYFSEKDNPSYGWLFEYCAEENLWKARGKLEEGPQLDLTVAEAKRGHVNVVLPNVEHVFTFQTYVPDVHEGAMSG